MPGIDDRRPSGKWFKVAPVGKKEKQCLEGTRERLTKEVSEAQKKKEKEETPDK